MAASLIFAACGGATDRAAFDEEVRARGGGIATTWIRHSIDIAVGQLDLADPNAAELVSITVDPASRSITVLGRRGDQPGFVDSVVMEREGAAPRIVVEVSSGRRTGSFGFDAMGEREGGGR